MKHKYFRWILPLCSLLLTVGCEKNSFEDELAVVSKNVGPSVSISEQTQQGSETDVQKAPKEIQYPEYRKNAENISKESSDETSSGEGKGYQLPVPAGEEKAAGEDCLRIMELYADLYAVADKGTTVNTVFSEEALLAMQQQAATEGNPVEVNVPYADLENYESMDRFLKESKAGQAGECTMYTVHIDGSLGRSRFVFDGNDMYLSAADAVWNKDNEPVFSHISYTRIRQWQYTEKGWFGYELCVPEPPEVTEIVDGSCLVRVLPYREELRRLSRQCVFGIGYGSGNLLDTDWDEQNMENLDFNSLFPCFYQLRYQERFLCENYSGGIPEQEYEQLMMQYLPVKTDALRKNTAYDAKAKAYSCEPMGCFTYTPDFIGTSLPEVTAVRENEDGTMTLTVDAVCDMVICDDAVITGELTVKMNDDGSFQYLGNKVIEDNISLSSQGND